MQDDQHRERRIDDTCMIEYRVKQDEARDEGVWPKKEIGVTAKDEGQVWLKRWCS
jgi:hypothetical protein